MDENVSLGIHSIDSRLIVANMKIILLATCKRTHYKREEELAKTGTFDGVIKFTNLSQKGRLDYRLLS